MKLLCSLPRRPCRLPGSCGARDAFLRFLCGSKCVMGSGFRPLVRIVPWPSCPGVAGQASPGRASDLINLFALLSFFDDNHTFSTIRNSSSTPPSSNTLAHTRILGFNNRCNAFHRFVSLAARRLELPLVFRRCRDHVGLRLTTSAS